MAIKFPIMISMTNKFLINVIGRNVATLSPPIMVQIARCNQPYIQLSPIKYK